MTKADKKATRAIDCHRALIVRAMNSSLQDVEDWPTAGLTFKTGYLTLPANWPTMRRRTVANGKQLRCHTPFNRQKANVDAAFGESVGTALFKLSHRRS